MAVATATWYHCNVKVISRSKPPRTAVGAAAYITGTCIYDRELEALPGYEPSDYRRKGGIEQWYINAPDNAPEWTYDVASLANEAQARDTRKNSCTARIGKLALPDSTDAQGRQEIAREFSDYLMERYGVAVIMAIHAPDRHGDDRNWHLHFWFTTREIGENGLGAKTRMLDDKATGSDEIGHIREASADIINRHLEEAGSDERVDHRSYEDRGIDRVPTEHMGAAAAMERRGERTERGDRNREIREGNRKIEQLENELAEVRAEIAWEQVSDLEEPEQEAFSFPTAQPDQPEPLLSWEEQKRQAVSAFTNEWTRAYMAQQPPEQEKQPPDVLQESEPEIDPVLASHKRDILEYGQVQETGLGRNWYDRTITMFENMYCSMIEQAQDLWQRYIMDRDRDRDPDREMDIDFDR